MDVEEEAGVSMDEEQNLIIKVWRQNSQPSSIPLLLSTTFTSPSTASLLLINPAEQQRLNATEEVPVGLSWIELDRVAHTICNLIQETSIANNFIINWWGSEAIIYLKSK